MEEHSSANISTFYKFFQMKNEIFRNHNQVDVANQKIREQGSGFSVLLKYLSHQSKTGFPLRKVREISILIGLFITISGRYWSPTKFGSGQ